MRRGRVIDGSGKAIVPPFYNTHTHAAMTLLRGYARRYGAFHLAQRLRLAGGGKADPGDDIRIGTRLAALEMIRTGTVFFNDMYWYQPDTVRAVREMGLRAAVGLLYISGSDGEVLERNRRCNEELLELGDDSSGRISVTYAPHAVYTVAEPILRRSPRIPRGPGG